VVFASIGHAPSLTVGLVTLSLLAGESLHVCLLFSLASLVCLVVVLLRLTLVPDFFP